MHHLGLQPSFFNGYATSAELSNWSEFWDRCVGAYMPLLGYQGNSLYNIIGQGESGTLTNMDPSTDWVSTDVGLSLNFLGSSNQYIEVLNGLSEVNASSEFSFLIGFRTPDINQSFKSFLGDRSNNLQIGLSTNGRLYWAMDVGGFKNITGVGVKNLSSDTHYDVAFIFNGNGVSKTYINAKQDDSASISGVTGFSTSILDIGRKGAGDAYTGEISYVYILKRLVSVPELERIHFAPLSPFSLGLRPIRFVSSGSPIPVQVTEKIEIEALETIQGNRLSGFEYSGCVESSEIAAFESHQVISKISPTEYAYLQVILKGSMDSLENLLGIEIQGEFAYESLSSETSVSKTEETTFESSSYTHLSQKTEIEAKASLSTSSTASLESLQILSKAFPSPLESLQSEARIFTAEIESMSGIYKAVQSAFEALGTQASVSKTAEVIFESMASIEMVKKTDIEALEPIQGTHPSEFEFKGRVASSEMAVLEARQIIGKISPTEYEYLQVISKASGASVESLLGIEVQSASVYEAGLGVQVVDITLELQAVFAPDIEVIAEF